MAGFFWSMAWVAARVTALVGARAAIQEFGTPGPERVLYQSSAALFFLGVMAIGTGHDAKALNKMSDLGHLSPTLTTLLILSLAFAPIINSVRLLVLGHISVSATACV